MIHLLTVIIVIYVVFAKIIILSTAKNDNNNFNIPIKDIYIDSYYFVV